LKELNNQVVEVKKEIDNIGDRQENLKSEIHLLEVEQDDLETNIKMKEQDERERLKPEIKRYQEMIDDMHNSIAVSKV
jgi:chromosome segregation ATPase